MFSAISLIVAIVLFLLAAFGTNSKVGLTNLGLAFFALSFLLGVPALI